MNVGTTTKEDLLKEVAELKAKVSILEETERELTKAKEFSKSVINSLPGVFYVIDNKGRVLIWNKNFEQAFGYTGQEIAKMHATDLFCEDEKWDMTDTMVRAFTKGDAKLEATAITKSGEQLPYYFTGKNATIDNEHYLLGMGIDISDRKQVEDEIRRLNSAIEQAHDGIAVFNNADRRISYANQAYTRMLGYENKSLIGVSYKDLNNRLLDNDQLTLSEVLDADNPNIQTVEIEHIRKDGSLFPTSVSFAHIKDGNGDQTDVIVVAKDITDQKLLEKELEAFNYSVSHDLRSPLRSVDGFSQALLEDYSEMLDANGKNYLERVRKASQRMGQLIDDLLGLSRLTRGEMKHETVDISAIAEEIVEELKLHDPKRKVEFEIAKNITAKADARMLRVALNNLLGNAWKFTGKTAEAVIEFGVTDDADGNRTYYVRDNGVGFNMEYSGKLFGAFQRLCGMNEFPGNGIGLATVQRVINRHGGTVWAEAEEGTGATFYFTI